VKVAGSPRSGIPHRLWIGRAVDSAARQWRHYRLLRRYGPAVIAACYERCSTFWHSLFQRGYRLSDRAERLRRMSPNDRQVRPWERQRYAAVHPEIVEAMSLYASSHRRSLALGEEEQMRLFEAEFHRRLPQERSLRTTARHWFLTEMIMNENQRALPGVE
jgi:hypothetical protein